MSENTKKKWVVKTPDTEEARREISEISASLGLHPVIAALLVNRDCHTPGEAGAFVNMEKEMLGNPFLLRDIEPAITRIQKALRDRERITVYGDYDVDGVTAVCTLYLYLKSKGADI